MQTTLTRKAIAMESIMRTLKKVPGWAIFFLIAFTLYFLAKTTKH